MNSPQLLFAATIATSTSSRSGSNLGSVFRNTLHISSFLQTLELVVIVQTICKSQIEEELNFNNYKAKQIQFTLKITIIYAFVF